MATLQDPVDKNKKEAPVSLPTVKGGLSLTLDQLQPISQKYSRAVHPFEGYPLKYEIIDGQKVCLTYLVAYSQTKPVFQDPSGLSQTIVMKGGGEKLVDLQSPPNVMVMDYENRRNTHIIFDREFTLADGQRVKWVGIVPSHSARAQIMFKYDQKTDKVSPNPDFLLFDGEQASRLRRVMENILKPSRKAERDAKAIMGESLESLDTIPAEGEA